MSNTSDTATITGSSTAIYTITIGASLNYSIASIAISGGNKGSVIYADGMLYCYDENTGDVALVKPSPEEFKIVSTFRVTHGDGQHWAHPAISDGRLYFRHGDALMAYGIKAE